MLREALVENLEQVRAVPVSAIEGELNQLWTLIDKPVDDWIDDEQLPVARSCMNNLIVVAGGEEPIAKTDQLARVLMERHPARVIELLMRPESDHPGVESTIRAHCRMPSWSQSYVCCEQITLDVRGRDEVRHVRGNLLPLLIPELQTVLWWPGSPFDHPLVGRLAELSNIFIVDSFGFRDLAEGFAGLLAIHDRPSLGVYCRDLNWARLTAWRSLIAQFFDSPLAIPLLKKLDYVTVSYTLNPTQSQPSSLAQPLLIVGWLAACLGWHFGDQPVEVRGERLLIPMVADGQALTVDLRPNDEYSLECGALVSVRLQARGSSPRAEFSVARLDDPGFVITLSHMAERQPVPRVARMNTLDVEHLISAELDLPGRDPTLIASLRQATGLAAMLPSPPQ